MCSEINRRRGVKRRDQFPLFASQSKKSRPLEGCLFGPKFEEGLEPRLLLDQSFTPSCAFAPLHREDVHITDVRESPSSSDFPGDCGLVLFQPPDLLMRSPFSPKLEIRVHPDLVDAMKKFRYQITSAYTPEVKYHTPNDPSTMTNLDVIPWVDPNIIEQTKHQWEPMEADNDSEMIDTEECKESSNTGEGLQQHQQPQNCLPPLVSQNIASPVRWW